MTPWIIGQGTCLENALSRAVQSSAQAADAQNQVSPANGKSLEDAIRDVCRKDFCVLAWFAGGFQAAHGDKMEQILKLPDFPVSTLMELRVFSGQQELWLHRSHLGTDFQWRLAGEKVIREKLLEKDDAFFGNPENYYLETWQLLDRTDEPHGEDNFGNPIILNTVGGHYPLPVSENDRYIKVIQYVVYDSDGAASIADYRLAGFADKRVEMKQTPQEKGGSA